jgi:hypothetical protein
MSQDHKENLNLLFYDFNKGAKQAKDKDTVQTAQAFNQTNDQFEMPQNMTNG